MAFLSRECTVQFDALKWRGRGMLLGQVVTPDMKIPTSLYFEMIW
jgi:hypothetical protein